MTKSPSKSERYYVRSTVGRHFVVIDRRFLTPEEDDRAGIVSAHKTMTEAEAALLRYEAADRRREG